MIFFGLYLASVIGMKVWPKEPVLPVTRMVEVSTRMVEVSSMTIYLSRN